jgi:molybdenum cofactor cytidylyltransferase
VFAADAFGTLRDLHGDKAVWKIVDTEPASRVRRIAVDRPLPRDIDTWDDYRAVCRALDLRVPPGLVPAS